MKDFVLNFQDFRLSEHLFIDIYIKTIFQGIGGGLEPKIG